VGVARLFSRLENQKKRTLGLLELPSATVESGIVDDEFDWLDDLPDEWRPPEELQRPTPIPLINFVSLVITSGRASNAIIERVALLLASHQRFNLWCQTEDRNRLPLKDQFVQSIEAMRMLELCWNAWCRHRAVCETGAMPTGDDYRRIFAALDQARVRFGQMSSGVHETEGGEE
jgi:hypothetical protein